MQGKESNIKSTYINVPGSPNTDIKWIEFKQATKESYEGDPKSKYIFDEQGLFPVNISSMENEGTGAKININNCPPHISVSNFGGTAGTSTFTLKSPLQIIWDPKEDITTYELAKCMDVLLRRYPIMPYEININESHMRNFNIIDHNK